VIVGAGLAFMRAQALKLEPSPLGKPRVERFFSPVCGCPDGETGTFAFTVKRPLRLDAEVLAADGRPVRSLAEGTRWQRGRRRLDWDGRDDRGRLLPDGTYRLRLRLPDREVLVPTAITLDTAAPRATLTSVTPRAVTTAQLARARAPSFAVRYRASEPSRAVLLVDGKAATRSGVRPPGPLLIRWNGRRDGRLVPPGAHTLAVRLRDRAGNSGRPTEGVRVRVRPSRRRAR
jgi:hypothetical protein